MHQAASDHRKGVTLLPERDKVFNGVRMALLEVVEPRTMLWRVDKINRMSGV